MCVCVCVCVCVWIIIRFEKVHINKILASKLERGTRLNDAS